MVRIENTRREYRVYLRRDELKVYCGNPQCFDPFQEITFKHYDDHLNFCYTKGKCPNCSVQLENINEAKAHFDECRKCKFCLCKIDLKTINEHDCHKNI